jgi:hypothetical protein
MKVLRPILTILLIAGIAAGGYYGYQRYQSTQAAAKKSSYETVALMAIPLLHWIRPHYPNR